MRFSFRCGRFPACRRWAMPLLLATVGMCSTQLTVVRAQENELDPNVPIIVINVASVDRLMNHAVIAFEAAGRPELSETLGPALERVNDLAGFDRNQSVGVMIYLNGVIPEAVGYAPVKNLDEVLKSLEIGPLVPRRTGEDRFEIAGRQRTFYGRVREDYAFFATSQTALNREFKDPAGLTSRLSRTYDIAAALNLRNIPPTTRELFLTAMRASSENDLQRRDNEPEASHKVRKAAGLHNIEFIEELINQGEDLVIGWHVSEQERRAALEIVMTGRPGSELAGYFNSLKGTRSRFANFLNASVPLTASLSWQLDKSGKKMLQEMLAGIELQFAQRNDGTAAESAVDNPPSDPVLAVIKALRGTAKQGHLDAMVQFVSEPAGAFVLVGGIHVADGEQLATAVADLLPRFKENDRISVVRLNIVSHNGVAIHRLEFRDVRPQDERLFGNQPAGVSIGVGPDVLWLAVGGESATAELKRAIEKGAEPATGDAASLPLQFVMNFSNWMNVFDPQKQEQGFASRARDAFSAGGDSLRIEARPVADGLRLRLTMDEAFLKLIGGQIAAQIDAQQEREQQQDQQQPQE